MLVLTFLQYFVLYLSVFVGMFFAVSSMLAMFKIIQDISKQLGITQYAKQRAQK